MQTVTQNITDFQRGEWTERSFLKSQFYLYCAFHNTPRFKADLQKIKLLMFIKSYCLHEL